MHVWLFGNATDALFAPWRELIVFFSRRGAKAAKNFYVRFILIPNTSANSAPLRDYMYFSLAEAQGSQRTQMFNLFLPKTPLRAPRLCEIIAFSSRRGAGYAEVIDVTKSKNALRAWRPGESIDANLSNPPRAPVANPASGRRDHPQAWVRTRSTSEA